MPKAIEETLKYCPHCKKKTRHYRNTNKTGLLMFLVHLVLTVVTFGGWLVLLVIWMILTKKVGGWTCSECPSTE